MKKTLTLILLLFSLACLWAKSEPDDLTILKQDPNIKVIAVYENAKLDGVTYEYLDSVVNANSDAIYAAMMREMEKKSSKSGLKFGSFDNARYLLHIQLLSIDEDGAMKAKVSVVDMQTVTQLTSFKIKAHGGVFGSFPELLKEAVARLGENVADYIIEHMK